MDSIASLVKRIGRELFSAKMKKESEHNISVMADIDVAVIGGGISGIISAICAARNGVKTILIEQQGCIGGLSTVGLVSHISNQFFDLSGKQITRGIVDEFMDRLAATGGTIVDWRDGKIPKINFDIEIFKLVAYDMLEEAGVMIMLNSFFSKAMINDDRIEYIVIENKAGRQAVKAKVFVDCTSDASVAMSTGVPCNRNSDLKDTDSMGEVASALLRKIGWKKRTEKTSSVQFAVIGADLDKLYNFIISNPDRYATYLKGEIKEDIALFKYLWDKKGIFYMPHTRNFETEIQKATKERFFTKDLWRYRSIHECGISIDGLKMNQILTVNANKVLIDPFSEEEVTKALVKGQGVCFEIWMFLKKYIPGFETSIIVSIAPMLGIRRRAQIIGKRVLTVEEREQELAYEDVIGMYCRQTKRAREIPFFCTVPQNITNLFVGSGKAVSTDDFVMFRTKPQCMVIGQAVGTAAALCIKRRETNNNLNIRSLQSALIKQGVYLGENDRLEELGLAS